MTLNEFFSKYLGKSVQYNVSNTTKYQCVDWAKCYCYEYLKLPINKNNWAWGDAKDWFTNSEAKKYFTPIKNTPDLVVKEGDLCIWGGKFGHISVATSIANTKRFVSMDQNVSGKHVTCEYHNYNGDFIGVLRPKK